MNNNIISAILSSGMDNLIETARKNVVRFGYYDVAKSPPLEQSVALAIQKPELVLRTFAAYHMVIGDVFTLNGQELGTIKRANEMINKPRGAHEFIEHILPYKKHILHIVRHSGNRLYASHRHGVKELTTMMGNAWEIKQAAPDWKPTDGSEVADRVIWGFVNGSVDPKTNIDFVMCHGIERVATAYLKEKGIHDDYINHKDWLLCAMNDVIALRGLQGKHPEKNVLDLWIQKRPDGLGWISQERLNAYKELLNKSC